MSLESRLTDKYLSSLKIPHAGNRAKVMAGIAHEMSTQELQATWDILKQRAQDRHAKLASLDAPECIMDAEAKRVDAILNGKSSGPAYYLARVLKERTHGS